MLSTNFKWMNESEHKLEQDSIWIKAKPHTDYYNQTHFNMKCANAPVFYTDVETDFTFSTKVTKKFTAPYDQAMVFAYQDDANWIKAGFEGSPEFQQIGGVVTQHDFSDWSTHDLNHTVNTCWLRIHRKENTMMFEYSLDGEKWIVLRIFHWFGGKHMRVGLYVASPFEGSAEATFTHTTVSECLWK